MGKKKSAGSPSDATSEKVPFEQALERLQQIVQQLEDGQLGLQESLKAYEQGVKYLRFCYQQLDEAERKIELLTALDREGRPVTEPFEEEDASLEEKQKNRSRRRSRRPSARPSAPDEAPESTAGGGLFDP